MSVGKHHSRHDSTAEQYGRHSLANARGLSVAALLAHVVDAGHAIRLAWRGTDTNGLVQAGDEFPTAVLPVIRGLDGHQAEPDGSPGDDQETEPTTATREARRWLWRPGFSWWPRAIAG